MPDYGFDPLVDCYCDGGGSIHHAPSMKCTVWHKQFEAEYEKQRVEYEAAKAIREAFPKPTIQNHKVNDNF